MRITILFIVSTLFISFGGEKTAVSEYDFADFEDRFSLQFGKQNLGWAVCPELMILEEGGQNNSSEIWLMYYKWRRATLTQVQLCSYFTGFTEIMELRQSQIVNLKS